MTFHVRDGWHFERLDGGDIRVTKRIPVQEQVWVGGKLTVRGHEGDPIVTATEDDDNVEVVTCGGPYVVVEDFTIPAGSWCSLVLAMGALVQDGGTLDLVHALHHGEKMREPVRSVVLERI